MPAHPKPVRLRSPKEKGSRLERKVARMTGGKRMVLSGAVGGGDVVLPGFSIECKKRARLPALLINAFAQAESDIRIGDPRRPLVVIEEDRGKPIACLYLEDLVVLMNESGPREHLRPQAVHYTGRERSSRGKESPMTQDVQTSELLNESEYLRAVEYPSASGKTVVVEVRSRRSSDVLGYIKWYGPWRQYTFHPSSGTLFNRGCLEDIAIALNALMTRRAVSR